MNDENRAEMLYVNAWTEYRSNEVVKLILYTGAEPNAHGGKFYGAIHAAAYAGRPDVVKLIRESGVDISSLNRIEISSNLIIQHNGVRDGFRQWYPYGPCYDCQIFPQQGGRSQLPIIRSGLYAAVICCGDC